MTIYISGPITGTPTFKTRFGNAAETLERAGHKVINPASLPDYAPKQPWSFYMAMAKAALPWCDAIYMLEGYERSSGAIAELRWALDNKLQIYREGIDVVPMQ